MKKIFEFAKMLEKNIYLTSILVIVLIVVFLWLAPVLVGTVLVITIVLLFLSFFSHKNVLESIKKIFLSFFIIGLISSPLIIAFTVEIYRINNPDLIIDRTNSELIKLTEKFRLRLNENSKNNLNDTRFVLRALERYIVDEISYSYRHIFFPSIAEVLKSKSSDCRGRAIVAFAILKNLGYDAYIVAAFGGGTHAWVRVYGNNEDTVRIRESISIDANSKSNKYFDEILTVPYVKKSWVIFNENEIYWDSPFNQLYTIFRYGFNVENLLIAGATTLFFLWPIILIGILIFIFKKIQDFRKYFLMILGATVVVLVSGLWGIFSLTILPLPIMLGGGLYLRWIEKSFANKI